MEVSIGSDLESEFIDRLEKYGQTIISDLLSQLTLEQKELFNRLHPGGLSCLKLDRLPHAYHQCSVAVRRIKEEQ